MDTVEEYDQKPHTHQPTSLKLLPWLGMSGLAVIAIVILIAGYVVYTNTNNPDKPDQPDTPIDSPLISTAQLSTFQSAEQMAQYWSDNQTDFYAPRFDSIQTLELAADQAVTSEPGFAASKTTATDIITTNVQVVGIDEPDILKTDGRNLYFSQNNGYPGPIFFAELDVLITEKLPATSSLFRAPQPENASVTHIIQAYPALDMQWLANLEQTGKLLLTDHTLYVFNDQFITSYDISDPANPTVVQEQTLDPDTRFIDARLQNNQIFAVLYTQDYTGTCGITPLANLTIPCDRIWYPPTVSNPTGTITLLQIEAPTGNITNQTTTIASGPDPVVYMSPSSIYITYTTQASSSDLMYQFVRYQLTDLLTAEQLDRLDQIKAYDLSLAAFEAEIQNFYQNLINQKSPDDRRAFELELTNRLQDFGQSQLRQLLRTGIIKYNPTNLQSQATAEIPGRLLNQFALDEYNGNLRVATTNDGGFIGLPIDVKSANDLYILNADLQPVGQIQDMGLDERIYAVRFMGNRGYIVTFRQIDPLYILDLSIATQPSIKGELKIPGYSSYLHQLNDRLLLGVGKEDANVKLSLFDIANPNLPVELDTYLLDEYWSESLDTHHAFYHDPNNQQFFIPGDKGGYVFTYQEVDGQPELRVVKAISGQQLKRATKLDDTVYLVSETNVVAYDSDWNQIKTLTFPEIEFKPVPVTLQPDQLPIDPDAPGQLESSSEPIQLESPADGITSEADIFILPKE